MRKSRFYFGRLNSIAEFTNKSEFILRGLSSQSFAEAKGFLWGFFDVEVLAGNEFVTGFLVKLSPLEPEEVGDMATRELTHTPVPNRAIAKSRFFLNVETGVIAHQYVSNQISDTYFRERFSDAFESSFNNFFVSVEIQAIEDRYEFFDALGRFSRIDEFSVTLHPTNPHYDEAYRRIDERIKRLRAKKYREQFIADRSGSGLDVLADEESRDKTIMAEDGYGEARAKGVLNGEYQSISTGANPMTAAAEVVERTPVQILEELMGAFTSIVNRIANG